MRAAVAAATVASRHIAGHRCRNHTAVARALQTFNTRGVRGAFACAAAASHRALMATLDDALADRQRVADERVQLARDAMLPWAQIRCGLERRRTRLAAKSTS